MNNDVNKHNTEMRQGSSKHIDSNRASKRKQDDGWQEQKFAVEAKSVHAMRLQNENEMNKMMKVKQ
jgi:hypothetical protein